MAARAADAGRRFARLCVPALVNGAAVIVARDRSGKPLAIVGFTVRDDRIATIDMILDPDKLPAGKQDR